MSHWSDVRLKNISKKITKGTTPTTLGYNFSEKGINFIKAESISKNGLINKNTFSFIDKKTHDALKRSQIEENDILVTIAGIYLGKIGYVEKEHTPANTNQAVAIVRLNQEKVIPKYVKYFLLEKSTNHFLNSLCPQTAQPNLNLTELGNLKFPLPPLPIQKKIAAVLSAYDDLIENNNRRIAILEKMAEEIYREWFVRMRFPGHEKVKFYRGLPEGWEMKEVGQLIEEGVIDKPLDGNHGERHPKGNDFVDEGIPFIMASDIINGYIDYANCKYITKKQADSLQKGFSKEGDVLLTHKATIGRTAIVGKLKTPYIMLTPQVTYYRIKNEKRINNIYLKQYLAQELFQQTLSSWAGSGGTRLYIGISAQEKLPILLPTPFIINKFKECTKTIYYNKLNLSLRNNLLNYSRNLLLSRLISGKLSIEGLDIKFPPSMEEADA